MNMSYTFRLSLFLSALLLYGVVNAEEATPPGNNQLTEAVAATERYAKAAEKSAKAAASAAERVADQAWAAPANWLLYGVPVLVFGGAFLTVLAVKGALVKTPWSLADALSEETQVSMFREVIVTKPDGTTTPTREVVTDKEGKPVLITEMRASSSRVIALMGMISILFLFVGFGVFVLFSFGKGGTVPESIDRVIKFIVTGLTLFAPYLVNKFASLFQGLSGGK